MKWINTAFIALFSHSLFAAGNEAVFLQSDSREVRFIEIFSSQGCSSCPPAERWVNTMTDSGHLWDSLFPMVFHVDYWNYLGWHDPYAEAAHSSRQSAYKTQTRINAVYTPGFVVNGKEWRGWFRSRGIPQSRPFNGRLNVQFSRQTLSAGYDLFNPKQVLNLVILGFGLKERILAGENRNLTIEQNFVVLSHQVFSPSPSPQSAEDKQWSVNWEKPKLTAPEYAIVVWVDRHDDLTPLQVTGSWLSKAFIQND